SVSRRTGCTRLQLRAIVMAAPISVVRRSVRGARWQARIPRIAFVAGVTVLCVLGVRSLVVPGSEPPPRLARSWAADGAAEAFATAFAGAYLTWDASRPDARRGALEQFSDELASQAAADAPAREQRVVWADVVQDQRAIAGGRIVTVAAQTTARDEPV